MHFCGRGFCAALLGVARVLQTKGCGCVFWWSWFCKMSKLSSSTGDLLEAIAEEQESRQLSSIFFDSRVFRSVLSKSVTSVTVADKSSSSVQTIKGLDGPMSIALMSNGQIAVTEWRGNSVSVLRKEGFRLLTFGRRQLSRESIIYTRLSGVPTKNRERHGDSFGELHEPTGIAATKRNQLIVADTNNHRLQLFTTTGTPLATVTGSDVEFKLPYDICIDSSDRVYVSDSGNHQIHCFTDNFSLSHKIGQRGSAPGQFEFPLGIAIDKEGMLYVCDRDNSRVQKMTIYGRMEAEFKHEHYNYPVKVAVDASNIVYVVYCYIPEVVMFDGNTTEYIGRFSGYGNKELVRPRGMIVDETGQVYVCDTSRNEILIF